MSKISKKARAVSRAPGTPGKTGTPATPAPGKKRKKKPKARRRDARATRKKQDRLRDHLMMLVDELHRIDDLLRFAPDIAFVVRQIDQSFDPKYIGSVDELATWARDTLDVDLDAGLDQNEGDDEDDDDIVRKAMNMIDLADASYSPNTIIEIARWRLLRTIRVMYLAIRAKRV